MSDETIYNAEWDGLCVRCGCHVADAWTALCSRCQQLLALEAEIGRAMINQCILNNAIWCLDKDWSATTTTHQAMSICDKALRKDGEVTRLIARWRQLHAGAEGER